MRLPRLISLLLLAGMLLAGCTSTDEPSDDGGGNDAGDDPAGDDPMTTAPATTSSSATGTTGSGPRSVDVEDNEFSGGTMTIAAGTTVEYANVGQSSHTVTVHYAGNNGQGGDPATTYKLDETLAPGEETSFTFSAAGTYHVFCRFHGSMTTGMTSTVTVT